METKKQPFWEEKEVRIKLSPNELYEIVHGCYLGQTEYGFDAPNQTPWNVRKKFTKVLQKMGYLKHHKK